MYYNNVHNLDIANLINANLKELDIVLCLNQFAVGCSGIVPCLITNL